MSGVVVVPTPVVPSESAWSGVGAIDDLVSCSRALDSGAWIDGALSGLALGAGVAGAAFDPLGAAVSWGAGWLLDHVAPLKGMLDAFAGDADVVAAYAATWGSISGALDDVAARYRSDVGQDTAGMRGPAVTAYVGASAVLTSTTEALAAAAGAVGAAVGVCAQIVRAVHDLIRDTLAEIIACFVASVCGPVAAAARAARLAIKAAEHISPLVDAVARTVRALLGLADDVLDAFIRTSRRLLEHEGAIDTGRAVATRTNTIGYFTTIIAPFVPPAADPAARPASP